MQKRYVPFAVIFVILLVLLTHIGARNLAVPAFAFADGGDEKKIYLTFDDGPSTVVTGRILDTLKAYDVKATFFIVSDRAESRQDTLKRIVDEGHTVGVHSKTHVYSKIYRSDDTLLADIGACSSFIKRVTGVKPTVYRFPGGGLNDLAHKKALVEELGYRVVSWNAECGDESIPHADAATLLKTAKETAKGKRTVVLLCHDSAHHKSTAEALPAIIEHFSKEGYTFCAF